MKNVIIHVPLSFPSLPYFPQFKPSMSLYLLPKPLFLSSRFLPFIFAQFSSMTKSRKGFDSALDETEDFDEHSVSNSKPDTFFMSKHPFLPAKKSSRQYSKRKTMVDLTPNEETNYSATFRSQTSHFHDKNSLPSSFDKKKSNHSRTRVEKNPHSMDHMDQMKPFSIILSESKKSTHKRGEDKQFQTEKNVENYKELRSGMVLLKNYFTLRQQVGIVKICQRLGVGPGGFYRPGYGDGAKLRLQMMCLGRNWDPQTKYDERFRVDGSEAPPIPDELVSLVKDAVQDSCAPEDELPTMSPDVCIVNFYTTSGRLGLHQDRDESPDSLVRGLPVVSFSIGDTAEFLYSETRDVDHADKVSLESGDVLIFGGKSRLIFHGIRAVVPNSAPPALLHETRLRPGRLNLTFRQF